MTTVIMKDKDWLKEQIESGIQGFLENESEYLISLIKKYVYEQIYLAAIVPHSESDLDGPATISINISIPSPQRCDVIISELTRKRLLEEDWPDN